MRARPRRPALPNLKVYRAAWVVTLILVVISLFTLGRPDTPRLSLDPVSFDGDQSAADLRTIVTDYPQRVAGSDPDNRLALWIVQQFKLAGLETHIDSFAATVDGKDVALQNIWALSRGDSAGTILVIANRDIPPVATQGANDNASGVAALLELARSFTVTAHDHSIIFLCTSGDAYGALGARRFADEHEIDNLYAVIALHEVATRDPAGIGLDGWSPAPKVAPPWLWLLTAPAARVNANLEALLPTAPAQVLRLAVPTSSGSQGPFVARGVPGITVSAAGAKAPPQNDTLDNVSTETLTKVGSTVQAMIMAIDGTTSPGARSSGTIFLTRGRTLPGGSLALILAAFLLPLAGVTVDLFAHCRRARIKLRPALLRSALHLAPWLALLAIIYLANLLGQLPRSPGAVIPPGSRVVDNPRYLRVVILVALLVLAYGYAVAVARRLERRMAIDPRATIFVAHAFLVLIAVLALLINPYAVLLVLPAAVIWPLAKPGGWARSILPAYTGLIMIPVVLVYYALLLGLGARVWWYFFLLLENRTIPAPAVLLGVLFLSAAGILAHALHKRGLAPGALTWPAIDRRNPKRMSDEEWAAGLGLESPRALRRAGRQRKLRPRRPHKQ
ncbi:MAG: M28 family peptidase [Actinomycetes bacterium]